MDLVGAVRAADWLRVRALVDDGVDPDARAEDGSTALMLAAGMGHMPIVSILLAAGADVNATGADDSDTAMLRAARSGRPLVFISVRHLTAPDVVERTERRLGRDPLDDWERYDERVPKLAEAAAGGRVDEVRRLLDGGLDVDTLDRHHGGPAITALAAAGSAVGVRTLLDAGADPEVLLLGDSTLIAAVRSGDTESVRLLLAAGADPAFTTFYGNRTPLMVAVQHGRREEAVLLLRAGADAHAPYATGMLAEIGPADAYPTEPRARLLDAAGRGDLDRARAALDAGVSPRSRNPRGFAALTLAATGGHLAVVEALLRAGAGVDRSMLHTALVDAAEKGHLPIVRALIRAGADVNARVGAWNTTPLCGAIAAGQADMVAALIHEFGADVNAPAIDQNASSLEWPRSGSTPLVHASRAGDPRVAQILRDAGATKLFGGLPIERLRGVWAFEEETPWLMVRASIEPAAGAFVSITGAPVWRRDVYDRAVEVTESGFFLIQFRGHPWTLIHHEDRMSRYEVKADLARAVSERLGGRALYCGPAESGGLFTYQLYESGRLLELFEVAHRLVKERDASGRPVVRSPYKSYPPPWGGVRFHSEWRDADPRGVAPLDFIDAFFRGQDLFLPRFESLDFSRRWARRDGPITYRLTGLDRDDFERVDFVSLAVGPGASDSGTGREPQRAAPVYDPALSPEEIESIAEALGRPKDILSIHREEGGKVRVRTGFVAARCLGIGQIYLLERAGEGWCVLSGGPWMS